MPQCWFCGEEHPAVAQCPHCLQSFCPTHAAPIDHDCLGSPVANPLAPPQTAQAPVSPQLAGAPATPTNPVAPPSTIPPDLSGAPVEDEGDRVLDDGTYVWYRKGDSTPDPFDPSSGIKIKGVLWPKGSELAHLSIGVGLIFGLALSIFLSWRQQGFPPQLLPPVGVLLLALFYSMGFLLHEFGHRQVGKHYNLPTKFRLFTFGVVLTALGLVTPLKVGFPGAVMVVGLDEISKRTGLCKVAGPTVNIVLGTTLFALSFWDAIPPPYNFMFCMGAFFNYQLGLFNLLPFGPLDGQNIMRWKPFLWAGMMIVTFALFAATLVIYSSPTLTESLYDLSSVFS